MTASPSLGDQIRAVEQATSALALLQATRALADRLAQERDPAASPAGTGAATPVVADGEADQEELAIRALVEVLGFNNPGAAVAAVDGLIAVGEAAVDPLLQRLDPRNYGARAWAVRALAGIGDIRGLPLLEEALASDVGPSVRRAAACGLGNLRLHTLPDGERPRVRTRALTALVAGGGDGEWVVRYAVAVGLEALVTRMEPLPAERTLALETLEAIAQAELEETPVVRLRARLAHGRLLASPSLTVTP
jgi:phycocyanobilin lyase beta subunit